MRLTTKLSMMAGTTVGLSESEVESLELLTRRQQQAAAEAQAMAEPFDGMVEVEGEDA